MRIIDKFRAAAIERLPNSPAILFNFQIGWSRKYDGVFDSEYEQKTDESAILTEAIANGRVLLCGSGGAAKTEILNRLTRKATELELLPIRIDLKLWLGKDVDRWKEARTDSLERLSQLLESSGTGITLPIFVNLPPGTRKVLLVDGLNELQTGIGEQITRVLDDAVTFHPGTCVIVSDRLVRRDLRAPQAWRFACVLPLSNDEISRVLRLAWPNKEIFDSATQSQRQLWSSPFFLDKFLGGGGTQSDKSSSFEAFFKSVPFTPQEIDRLARVAFLAYRESRSRAFPSALFARHVSKKIRVALEAARVIVRERGITYFNHHLAHDYLASRYLRNTPAEWNYKGFDTVTFYASSFDSLALAIEQLSDRIQAERFVRELYDWNPYAAAYCLNETKSQETLSREMQLVVFAMLTERKWDPLEATARRASDALLISSNPISAELANLGNLADLFVKVNAVRSNEPWFNEWRQLFTTPKSKSISSIQLQKIQLGDSIVGWTAANVLKRTLWPPHAKSFLKGLLSYRAPRVRWRAVHALGSIAEPETVRLFFRVLDTDASEWVRFGAARSLVEVAAAGSSDIRKSVFMGLQKRITEITDQPRIRKELESVMLISNVGRVAEWMRCISNFYDTLFTVADSGESRERFEFLVRKFKKTYAARLG